MVFDKLDVIVRKIYKSVILFRFIMKDDFNKKEVSRSHKNGGDSEKKVLNKVNVKSLFPYKQYTVPYVLGLLFVFAFVFIVFMQMHFFDLEQDSVLLSPSELDSESLSDVDIQEDKFLTTCCIIVVVVLVILIIFFLVWKKRNR